MLCNIAFSFLIFICRADEATYLLSASTTRGSVSMSRDPDRKGKPTWRRIVGFLLIVMSSLCVALSTGCVQALERRVPDIELTFGGKFALLLFTLPVYFCTGEGLLFSFHDLNWQAVFHGDCDVTSGGFKEGASGTRPPSKDQHFLNFMQFFGEIG